MIPRKLLIRLLQRALLALALLAVVPVSATADARTVAALVVDGSRVEAEPEPERAYITTRRAPLSAIGRHEARAARPEPRRFEASLGLAPLFLKHCAWLC